MKLSALPFLFLITLLSISCSDFLDDPRPVDEYPLELSFQTGADLQAALTGTYDLIQNGRVMGGFIPSLADFIASNAQGWDDEVSSMPLEPTHLIPEQLWIQSYRAINQCNAILQVVQKVHDSDATFNQVSADRITGEAHFIRAVLYFELVRLFSLPYDDNFLSEPAIPLVLEPTLAKEDIRYPAQATVGEVYNQIREDLEQARELLPEDNIRGRVTWFAATGYLARLSFQQRDYAGAAFLSEQVQARDDIFQLTPNPQKYFIDEGSSEEIWIIYSSAENDPIVNGLSDIYNTAQISPDLKENGYSALLTDEMVIGIEQAGYQLVDLRCDPLNLYSENVQLVLNADSSRCNKYELTIPGENDAPALRLAELLLMRAEALARTAGVNGESVMLLNDIRRRSMRLIDQNGMHIPASEAYFIYQADDFINAGDLIDAIQRERRVELAFEGNYLHDLKRLRRQVKNGTNVYEYDDCRLLLPIPQRELDANPNLKQNCE